VQKEFSKAGLEAEGVALVEYCLSSKHKALSSSPQYIKKKKKTQFIKKEEKAGLDT
jgi:hypothetical protein